jgi:actin related protein 2/3 complex subunit 1A/1B
MSIGCGRPKDVEVISCHAFSPDLTQLALSPNSNEIWIFEVSSQDPSKWAKTHVLSEHDSFVSGIDWSVNNQIVSCGHDRNAYVWELNNYQWNPKLVILRISRAATAVKWSPSGDKFAVTSGAKMVPVCHYQADSDWWVSQLIKKHRSTVLALDWHPNNKFLVTGSSDFKCRIFSAYLDECDDDADSDIWEPIFPKYKRFGALLAKFDQCQGWVESVSWAPSGYALTFTAHDSSIHFAHIYGEGEPYTISLNTPNLPFRDVAFLSDYCVLAVGYDNNPMLYVNQNTAEDPAWQFVAKVDKEKGVQKKKKTGFAKNRNIFEDASAKNVEFGSEVQGLELKTRHQNAITQVSIFANEGTATTFVTTGIDGRIEYWNLGADGFDLAALGLQF